MTLQERIIVPGLGAVILLAVLTMGAPILYTLLLGLLGLAAVGTYFVPSAVQVETRVGIAVLGLIVLIFYFSSLSFWLALLSFGAIGALQIRHRDELQKNPATVAWLNAALARRGPQEDKGGPARDASSTGGDGVLGGRVHIAGILAAVMGIAVLSSVFMPWAVYSISAGGESHSSTASAIRAAEVIADLNEGGAPLNNVLFGAGIVLALLSIVSTVLPRAVPIIVGIAGMLLTLFAFVYISVGFHDSNLPSEVSQATFPHIGFFVTGGAFLSVTVLHVIPAAYRPIGGNKGGD